MSNNQLGQVANVFGQATDQLIRAMYSIWGVVPDRAYGSYTFQTDPYPIVSSATANVPVTGSILISLAGAFVLTKHMVYAATLDFTIGWTFSGSDRRWTSRQNGGHVNNLGGTGVWPHIYPKPYIWDGGSLITCLIVSLTANARDVYWDFEGWRIWDIAALDLTRRAM